MGIPSKPSIETNLDVYYGPKSNKNSIVRMAATPCYFLGDLLEPSGVNFLPGELSLRSRPFHKETFPKIKVPPKFQEVWQYAIRRVVQQHGIGGHLGSFTNGDSRK